MGCGNCGSRGSQWVAITYLFFWCERNLFLTFTTSTGSCQSLFFRHFCPSTSPFRIKSWIGPRHFFQKEGDTPQTINGWNLNITQFYKGNHLPTKPPLFLCSMHVHFPSGFDTKSWKPLSLPAQLAIPPHLVRYTKARCKRSSCAAFRLIHPTLQCSGSRYTLGPTYSLEETGSRVVIWWLAVTPKSVPTKNPWI